ncbi:MAG: hypothetical protein APF76_09425 [Desulfitibacter sp. BRH_c19]|nr:MAG: hypothetical protein APF76_09425 [Desulfitibacter sp. BRH_c19]
MTNNAEKVRVKVDLLGQEYIIIGDKSSEHILKVAGEVNDLMNKIHQNNPHMPQVKIAVLTALNLADELTKTRDDYTWLLDLIEDEKKATK